MELGNGKIMSGLVESDAEGLEEWLVAGKFRHWLVC
jgi:hypothetical protein